MMHDEITPSTWWEDRGKHWVVGMLTAAVGYFAGTGMIAYTRDTSVFNLERIEVRGNDVLTRAEVVEALDLSLTTSLFELSLPDLQARVENLAYVYGVRVGRTFPHTLFVDVVENRPLAYVAGPEYFVLTAEGEALPLPHGRMELVIPTIAGIDTSLAALDAGTVTAHPQLERLRSVLRYMDDKHPEIFAELSELVMGENGDVTLYLSETSTAVHLNSHRMEQSIALLNAFLDTIKGKRTLRDYTYIDLRYNRQIVVKERA